MNSARALVRFDPEDVEGLRVERGDGRYVVELPGWARFELDADGAPRGAAPLAALDDATLAATYAHYVAPLAEQLRGRLVLHASAVVVEGSAIAFVGVSGVGKSTLAALLADRGHGVLGDDWIAVELGGGDEVLAHPSDERVLRLRAGAVGAVRAPIRPGRLDDRGAIDLAPVAAAPLRRVFVLEEAAELTIRPLSRRDAVLAVAARLHRIDPTDPTLLRRELEQLDALAARVPVAALAYPRRFDHASALLDAVEGALR